MRLILAKLFEAVVRARALAFRKGLLKTRCLPRPVVSVGNLTTGGTGKTPLVAFICKLLQKEGFQPVVLSRGYRGTAECSTLIVSDGEKVYCGPEQAGDEPYLLARTLGVPVVVGKDRYRAGIQLCNRITDAVFVLDDGYQYLRLKRDLNLLVLDASDPFGDGYLLPKGRLREPLSAMKRADAVLVTRAHLAFDAEELEGEIRTQNPLAPIWYFYHDVVVLYDLRTMERYELASFFNRNVVAFAGIGNPGLFLRDLNHHQVHVKEEFIFPDHHAFTQQEIDRILARAAELGVVAVTTEKDAVRLERLRFGAHEVFALEIEAKAEEPQAFRNFLIERLD
ncbi:MAG: tetraacyldisaccharide 4'-kinase [Acidobacteria bacterium]|nr:tetraacyldisaccharide 4'-kinase [Acidobacteriota bacterium]